MTGPRQSPCACDGAESDITGRLLGEIARDWLSLLFGDDEGYGPTAITRIIRAPLVAARKAFHDGS